MNHAMNTWVRACNQDAGETVVVAMAEPWMVEEWFGSRSPSETGRMVSESSTSKDIIHFLKFDENRNLSREINSVRKNLYLVNVSSISLVTSYRFLG